MTVGKDTEKNFCGESWETSFHVQDDSMVKHTSLGCRGCIMKCLELELALELCGAPEACVSTAELVPGGSSGMICLGLSG